MSALDARRTVNLGLPELVQLLVIGIVVFLIVRLATRRRR
jgi:hypothetical protein